MEWIIGISVLFNIVLALLMSFLIYGLMSAKDEAYHNHQEWGKWEQRFYEAQGILIDDHDLFLSAVQGAYGQMLIKKHTKE